MADNEDKERDEEFENDEGGKDNLKDVVQLSGMYEDWFLDYASYVILERAVPHVHDGLKPVQRRILHSMKEMDDGRYHKVANIVGNTMKYHPHGDASIVDALVQLGQKNLLVDTQGNWGNIYTGDRAAAPRYIEARLTKFALEVLFNEKTTQWEASYDGRNREPLTLPVKFPLLLAQGVEGIAVGLACKILPHNFNELIDASVKFLKGQSFKLVPDFPTGGMADFSNYNDGLRGGRVRIRAKIEKLDNKTLKIVEIPFGTTTQSLIDSILKANDKGKIKIKRVEDNTAEKVEIIINLTSGVSPDKMIDALYAFTDCEVSLSPNACVISEDKPQFLGVKEMLKLTADRTVHLLTRELEIQLGELHEKWHFASLERIFIENRIYRDIEECETWEAIIETIHKGLKPHIKHLKREVTDEDVARLTEIRIKRISRFDLDKAAQHIESLEETIEQVKHNLDNIVDYTIDYYKELKKKYGEGRERKTEIRSFENIDASKVAVKNVKLYANRKEGFIGTGLKRTESEFVCNCSDIDNIIVFLEDGRMMVTKVASKAFVGKNIIHARVWKRGDKRTIYNMIYQDGKSGPVRQKRFAVKSITRDREYDLTKGNPGSRILYFSANPNGEAEVVTVFLKQKPKLKKLKIDVDFAEMDIKGRGAGGNIVTKHVARKVEQKEKGVSTLGGRKIWFDDTVQRLNTEGHGEFLGEFFAEDKILTVMQSGEYRLTGFDLTTHFDEDLIIIEKWNPEKPISAVYYDGEREKYYVKRFLVEDTPNKTSFITDHKDSFLEVAFTDRIPRVKINFRKIKGKRRDAEEINLKEFIDVKGMKAIGNQLTRYSVKDVEPLEPITPEGEEEDKKSPEEGSGEGPNKEESDKKEKEAQSDTGEKSQPSPKSAKEKKEGKQKPASGKKKQDKSSAGEKDSSSDTTSDAKQVTQKKKLPDKKDKGKGNNDDDKPQMKLFDE